MKFNELHKKLQKNGWHVVRHGSNHDLWGHPDRPGILIPVGRHGSKEIATGTLKSILKMAGLK